ncbi:MAG: ABC-F family ATP-binding cassette domain-containing protein [Lentisphaeria bacterium]|nr:ABC-F family ATP-binding cassette domain-containing protein [Lentisphaeria bacterium]
MIQFNNVSKSFGLQQVIIEASFAVHDGERVGVVGPNGAGKSTLFEMLAGRTSPDKGDCSYPSSQRLGYVRQQLHPFAQKTSLLEYTENAVPEIQGMQLEMERIEHELDCLTGEDQARALKRLGNLQTEFEHLGGYDIKNRAEAILSGLGFSVKRFHDLFASFSGGWQIRAELARVLVAQPDILLLDEPTNYLDVPAVEWLRDFLKTYAGTLLLVSHDRFLLNSLTSVTIEVMGGHTTRYNGNYARYMQEREARHDQLIAQKRNIDRKKEQLERFIDRFKGKATKASQAQSKQKQLDRLEDIEVRSITIKGPRIRLPKPPRSGQEVIRLEQAAFSYDGKNPVFSQLDLRLERGDRAAMIGLNGMGKTTLLRLIAGHLTLTEGKVSIGHGVEMGYQSQDYADTMDPDRNVFETVKTYASDRTEGEIRQLLGGFGFHGDDIDKRVQVLSGGEKVRLGLARLLLRPLNFLLLDEPTTHLDIYAREALEEALQTYEGTLCLVSHDIEFVKAVANTIFYLTPDGITRYFGNYEYFRHKLAEEQALKEGTPPPAEKVAPAKPANSTFPVPAPIKQAPVESNVAGNRKQRKRDEAMIRNEIGKLKKPQEAIVAASEACMEALDQEQKNIYTALAEAKPDTDFAALNRRLIEIKKEMDCEASRWEEASDKLERLSAECEARIAELQND